MRQDGQGERDSIGDEVSREEDSLETSPTDPLRPARRGLKARVGQALRMGGALGAFAGAAALAHFALGAPSAPARAAIPEPAEIRVAGQPLASLDLEALASEWANGPLVIRLPEGEPVHTTRGALGGRVDQARLAALLGRASDPGSTLRRLHYQLRDQQALDLPLPILVDETPAKERFWDLKDQLDRAPTDARMDPRTGEPEPHQHGRVVDVHASLDALRVALESQAEEMTLVAAERRAQRTLDELEGVSTEALLGFYETRYSSAGDARERTFNLRVAAAKIDGSVLLPGETLVFNEVVGERSEANGFRPAPVIAAGELVDGVGGGTCQVAGTLHAAAFFAGLGIGERSPHSRPSSYIYMGLDAVVSYPNLDLRLTNDRDIPVVIGFTVEGGVARAEIRGAHTSEMVSFVRRVIDVTAYDEREVEDSTLPRGVRVLRQRGVPGFRTRNYRIVRDIETNQAIRTAYEDTYPPTTQIWRRGTGAAPPEGYEPPAGDTHGEYTADEYLSVTQGAGVDGVQVIRRAGRTGSPGWTERSGFPSTEP